MTKDVRIAVRLTETEKTEWDTFATNSGFSSTAAMIRKAVHVAMGKSEWKTQSYDVLVLE